MTSPGAYWSQFTSAWESGVQARDAWDRVSSKQSPHGPVVEPMLSQRLYDMGFRPSYPNGCRFAVCLSHDVDVLITSQREMFGTLRRGRLPLTGRNLARVFSRGVDPRFDLDHLLRIEQRSGVTSTFYFLALEPGEEDHNFSLGEIVDQVRMVEDAGCEIGLHGGHTAYNHGGVMAEEKRRLEHVAQSPISGYRNHYLRFNTPRTWQLLEEQGFRYDTTFGFSDSIGFRNGMCYPFRPLDPRGGGYMSIVEIPLVVMDISLFDHMGLSQQDALALWHATVDKVIACSGVLTLLWHNSYPTVPLSVYGELVAGLAEKGAWFTTGDGLVDHWTRTGQLATMEGLLTAEFAPRA